MTERTIVGSAQTEQESQRRGDMRNKPQRQPRYNVILWDDDEHTYQYVIRMVTELFAHSPEDGYEMAREVDRQGRVVVLTTTMEHAELKRDQIHAYGRDGLVNECVGSMSSSIEPVG